jgi:hypothetical protein
MNPSIPPLPPPEQELLLLPVTSQSREWQLEAYFQLLGDGASFIHSKRQCNTIYLKFAILSQVSFILKASFWCCEALFF